MSPSQQKVHRRSTASAERDLALYRAACCCWLSHGADRALGVHAEFSARLAAGVQQHLAVEVLFLILPCSHLPSHERSQLDIEEETAGSNWPLFITRRKIRHNQAESGRTQDSSIQRHRNHVSKVPVCLNRGEDVYVPARLFAFYEECPFANTIREKKSGHHLSIQGAGKYFE